jgi:hypothetical protein
MPYRIDIGCPPPDAVDVLVELGALDIEPVNDGLAAIMPDGVAQDMVAAALAYPASAFRLRSHETTTRFGC